MAHRQNVDVTRQTMTVNIDDAMDMDMGMDMDMDVNMGMDMDMDVNIGMNTNVNMDSKINPDRNTNEVDMSMERHKAPPWRPCSCPRRVHQARTMIGG